MRPWTFSLFAAVVLGAQPAPRVSTPEDIAQAVRQLGDVDFAVREKASTWLWQAGRFAEPALREAAKGRDAEVARRSREVLDRFVRVGYPDTPKQVAVLIQEYWAGGQDAKRRVIQALYDQGLEGFVTLIRLIEAEDNPDLQRRLWGLVADSSVQLAARLIPDGKLDDLERVLELGLEGGSEYTARRYAVWHVLRGQSQESIRRLQQRLSSRPNRALTYLYVITGDKQRAVRVAEQVDDRDWRKEILFHAGHWAELSKSSFGVGQTTQLGYRAAFHRLAGNRPEFERAVQDLMRHAREAGRAEVLMTRNALLLNERPAEAIAMLRGYEDFAPAFRLLTAQLQYREAFELAESADNGADRFALDLHLAQTLFALGEQDRAKRLFARLAQAMKEAKDNTRYDALVEAEYRAGWTEAALAHCAWLLEQRGEHRNAFVLGVIFPGQWQSAQVLWWIARRQHPGEAPEASLGRVCRYFRGRSNAAEFTTLLTRAVQDALNKTPPEPDYWLKELAELCEQSGLDDLARQCHEQRAAVHGSSASLLSLGDFLARKKLWDEAARRYSQSREKAMAERDSVGRPLSMDFTQAAALYLQGWALELAGPVNEGRQLQERAKLLAFDIPDSHLQLARTLALLGRTKEADRHCALIPLLTIVSAGTNAHWLRTELALKANDDFLAADCWERYLLCLLTSGSGGFGDPEAYLAAAQQVHLYRARGHLARGHVEAALSEVQLAMRLLPGDVELPIDLVPQLDKLGRKPEADNLFHRVFSLHEAVCSDYPRAAGHHNQAAWLPARCRRQLDKGLEHARRAVELAPDNPTYLDTLAEVHFQRGDTDRAVELAKRCVELEPADNYYDRQLDRFRAGDPMADVPQRVPNDR